MGTAGMSARDVICDVLSVSGYETERMYGPFAQDILDALDAAGYGVVKLPEPTRLWTDGLEWLSLPGNQFVYTREGGSLVAVRNVGPQLSPAEARLLATAILAAADHAEQVQP